MRELSYRLRNDAALLAGELGTAPFLLPGGYELGTYAGLTRGELEHWRIQIAALPNRYVERGDQSLRTRQPMLDLVHLIGLYSASAFVGSNWIDNPRGQALLLDWVDRGCADPIPFPEEVSHKVVTEAFRGRLLAIRAQRIGWVLDPEDQSEYFMIWMDEEQVANFKARHMMAEESARGFP